MTRCRCVRSKGQTRQHGASIRTAPWLWNQQPEQAAPRQVEDHLVVTQPLATLHRPEVPYQAILAAAHASQPAIPEASHGGRECIADRFRQILMAANRLRSGR